MLKLIRNNFIDHGFTLEGNKQVSSDCVNELVTRCKNDLKTTHRLSLKHLDVKGSGRMRVSLAAQLLSETRAKTLKYFGEQGLLVSKNWAATSNFTELTDSWFELMNSRVPRDSKKRKRHACDLERQKSTLETMVKTVAEMRVTGHSSLYPFQKGIIISSKSLLDLYETLKETFDVSYILTQT